MAISCLGDGLEQRAGTTSAHLLVVLTLLEKLPLKDGVRGCEGVAGVVGKKKFGIQNSPKVRARPGPRCVIAQPGMAATAQLAQKPPLANTPR